MTAGLCPRAKQVLQLIIAEGRITRSTLNRTLNANCIASHYARNLVDAGILVSTDADDPVFSLASDDYANLAAATRRIRQYREMQRARRIGPVMTTAPMLDNIVSSLATMGANQSTELYLY